MTEKLDLPSYRRPPVIEVVCGLQFDAIEGFTSAHFGKFWSSVSNEYPHVQDREPLAEVFENLKGRPQAEIVPLILPPLRRVFYIDTSGNYLLQIQPSRFLANWRKVRNEDEYPRFNTAYKRFLRGWEQFSKFLRDENLSIPRVNQYELTYINHIFEATTPFPEGIQEHLRFYSWRNAQSLKFLPAPRLAQMVFQFALPDSKGTLHLVINHGTRVPDNKSVMMMEFTVRGPARANSSDRDDWFAVAHEWIVKGFTDLTTAEAHKRWERES